MGAQTVEQVLIPCQDIVSLHVGDLHCGRLQHGVVDIAQLDRAEHLGCGDITFAEADAGGAGTDHGGVVDGLDGQCEGAGRAVQVGVEAVHHRVADLDVAGAVGSRLEFQAAQLTIGQVHQGASRAQGQWVAVGVKQAAAGDRQDAHLAGGLTGVALQVGDSQAIQNREAVFLDGGKAIQFCEIYIAARLGCATAEQLDIDDLGGNRLWMRSALAGVLGGHADAAGLTAQAACEAQALQAGVDVGQGTREGVGVAGVDQGHTIECRQGQAATGGGHIHGHRRAVEVADDQAGDLCGVACAGHQSGRRINLGGCRQGRGGDGLDDGRPRIVVGLAHAGGEADLVRAGGREGEG